jgi:hypothetical protein
VYVEFDHRGQASPRQSIMMFAYGERLTSSDTLDFEPVVARAEHRAKFHRDLLEDRTPATSNPLRVLRREWFIVRETNLASVQIYFEL